MVQSEFFGARPCLSSLGTEIDLKQILASSFFTTSFVRPYFANSSPVFREYNLFRSFLRCSL